MLTGYIYKYTFPNGKVYIGQTRKDIEIRKEQHIDPISGPTNPGFWSAYTEFGTYEFDILQVVKEEKIADLKKSLNDLESYFIIKYKANDPNFGYNKKGGNWSNFIYDDNENEVSQAVNDEYTQKFNIIYDNYINLYYAVFDKLLKASENFSEKEMSFIKEFFHFNKKNRRTLKDYNLFHIEFNTPKQHDKFRQVLNDGMQDFIDNKYKELLKYYRDNIEEIKDKYRKQNCILAIDKDGNDIREFANIYEVEEEFGSKKTHNIKRCLKGQTKTAYGYKWCYRKDLPQ